MVFGNLTKILPGDGMLILTVVLFLLPIVYNYTIGRAKKN